MHKITGPGKQLDGWANNFDIGGESLVILIFLLCLTQLRLSLCCNLWLRPALIWLVAS